MKKRSKAQTATWTIREPRPLAQVQGGARQLEPAKLEFPNITIYVAE